MTEVRSLDTDLWVVDSPMRFCGLEVGTRMTIVRLSDGRLWLHSPIEATDDLVAAVAELGEVGFIVAPNRWHHMFVASWQAVCPDAQTFAAPGLQKKRPDLLIDEILSDEAPAGWADTLDQVCVAGMPMISEVVFFHRPSATLLLTDLAFNFQADTPFVTRCFIRLAGRMGQLAPTVMERLLTRDKRALASSLDRVLEFPFERVVVTHGHIVASGGREQLQSGYAWALGAARAHAH